MAQKKIILRPPAITCRTLLNATPDDLRRADEIYELTQDQFNKALARAFNVSPQIQKRQCNCIGAICYCKRIS